MAQLRRGFQARSLRSSPKRLSAWGGGPADVQGVIAGTGKTLWGAGTVTTESQVTIVRLRGMISMRLILSTSAGDGFHGAVGIGIATSAAFAIGVTALPGPITNVEWGGWMWHQFFQSLGVAVQSVGADVPRNTTADLRIPIDSKAMRKFGQDQVLFGMYESTEVGVASLTLDADTRLLAKLS